MPRGDGEATSGRRPRPGRGAIRRTAMPVPLRAMHCRWEFARYAVAGRRQGPDLGEPRHGREDPPHAIGCAPGGLRMNPETLPDPDAERAALRFRAAALQRELDLIKKSLNALEGGTAPST